MKVDLYTDAGVKDNVATWATVAIIPGQAAPIEASGQMREPLDCPSTAELRAIANALHSLLRAGHISRGCEVRVYTDSLHAVQRISGAVTRKPKSTMAAALTVITKIAATHGITVSAQWVKGHQRLDSDCPHAPHNRRCDVLCRIARGEIPGERDPKWGTGTSSAAKKRRAARLAAQQGAEA